MDKQEVIFKDLGIIDYKTAWDYQEELLQKAVEIKRQIRSLEPAIPPAELSTTNHLLFCEHPAVYTLGKSGKKENVLMSDEELEQNHIEF